MADWYTPRYLNWEQAAFELDMDCLRLRKKIVGVMFEPVKVFWKPRRMETGCPFCSETFRLRQRVRRIYWSIPEAQKIFMEWIQERANS